jgi:predicted nucleotide-binding protein (sugar kinase/HSP70/actin superfamily)
VKKAKSSVIYIRRIILMLKEARLNKEHILTKNRKDKSKTNKTRAKDRTSE